MNESIPHEDLKLSLSSDKSKSETSGKRDLLKGGRISWTRIPEQRNKGRHHHLISASRVIFLEIPSASLIQAERAEG
jgi:hypothetical protein